VFDQVTKEQIRRLRTDTEDNKKDLWRMVLEVYGALRGYTVILSSTGSAAEHQPSCLGVYRVIGNLNNKPLYKQDDGENYLYYQKETKSWLVGPNSGDDYAWIKNDVGKSDGESDGESSSSSSSSESDSDTHEGDKEIRERKPKLKPKPKSSDLFKKGWKYKSMALELSPPSEDGDDSVQWREDDATLRVEALRDIQMIGDVIQEIKRAKQVD
jgi:hypothetical protein